MICDARHTPPGLSCPAMSTNVYPMTTTDLLTVAEAAAHYKVSEKTIRRWIAAGRIKAVRPGERTIRVIVDKAVA